jgi:hypothetical protein
MKSITAKDAGCWVDSAWGHDEMFKRILKIAEYFGYKDTTTEEEKYSDYWLEIQDSIWDECEEFLNFLAPDGFYFGSSEQGDWGLWPIEDYEEPEDEEEDP